MSNNGNQVQETEVQENQNIQQPEPDQGEPEAPEQESSQEDYKSKYENMLAALKEERNKYKGVDPEEYERLKKERHEMEEKDKLKKGKYEEVINGLKEELSESKQYKEFYEQNLAKAEGKLEALIEQVPEEKRDFVNKVIDGKDVFTKTDLVKELIPTFKKQDFSSTPSAQ